LPYGESASAPSAFGYTAQRIDAEINGLYYYRTRHYSPLLGRFLQTDPSGTKGGINLYAYAKNDPLNLVDIYGRAPDAPSVNSNLTQLQLNVAQGQAGEESTEELLGESVVGKQVTFITSTGARTRIDFVASSTTDDETNDENSLSVVETKTGNAQLTLGQQQLQADVYTGIPVTPVGQNAANAGFDVGEPVILNGFTVYRPF
jgi:RHS repeat-associated protein